MQKQLKPLVKKIQMFALVVMADVNGTESHTPMHVIHGLELPKKCLNGLKIAPRNPTQDSE